MPKTKKSHKHPPVRLDVRDKIAVREAIYDELLKAKKEATDLAIDTTQAIATVYSAVVLFDRFGFTKEQIEDFVSGVNKLSNNIYEGYTYNMSAIEVFRDEIGLEVPEVLNTFMEMNVISKEE